MIFLAVSALILAAIVAFAWYDTNHGHGVGEFGMNAVCAVFALSFVSAIVVSVMLINARFEPRIEVARIETLRRSVATVPDSLSHAIYVEAIQHNQTIAEMKEWRRIWWSRDFVNRRWESIEPIALRKESR
jgi:uncharacterized membrane protein